LNVVKTPPLLLGATLVFWGWQTGHVFGGAAMAIVLEGARLLKVRWDFTDEDFRRIWTFCALLLLATALYTFTAGNVPSDHRGFFPNPSLVNERTIVNTSSRTVSALIRSLPMIFFLFIAGQAYSSRQGIAPETISVILRLRWQKARQLGLHLPPAPSVDVSYPYFILCLVSAGFHSSADESFRADQSFYWGLCLLVIWALWPQRSRRYGIALWAGTVAMAMLLGFAGQRGVGRLYRLFENYNAQWLARPGGRGTDPTHSKTALGHIGRLKASGSIVIRLEPKEGSRAPSLLREASYHTWKGQVWLSETGRDRFDNVREETNQTSWLLVPGKTNAASVSIACYLPGGMALLPLPPGSSELQNLSAWLVQRNDLGAVLAQGPGLVVFDALYGPGAPMMDSPGNTNEDLRVPAREAPALNRVVEELQLEGQNRKQALRTLSAFFADQFHYSMWQGLGQLASTNETPLARFLLRSRSGHCEYFATATVLLLRRIGIPARYAVGFAVHEASGKGYVVRQRDAHAWCLVWNAASETWQDFDTTPATWMATEANRASPLQALGDWWSRMMFEISKFRWGQTHLRQYVLWGLVPVLSLLLYRIVFRIRRRQRLGPPEQLSAPALWPGLDSEFYHVERILAQRVARRLPGEPLAAWLLSASNDPALAEARDLLRRLLHLHYRYRFDPQGLKAEEREALRRDAMGCLARLG
jgi:protein-glutamine gamma-glutamyltransferase